MVKLIILVNKKDCALKHWIQPGGFYVTSLFSKYIGCILILWFSSWAEEVTEIAYCLVEDLTSPLLA